MKQDILTIGFFLVITLYILGFLFAVRQVINSTQPALVKALVILGLFFFLVVLCLGSFFLLAFSTNPWAH
jgi:hypothetical protein